ncbi:hypothetical protein LOK49_LG14G01609 [Camellia lanceoleosa]|uniref:Uncharacterized protein n=1 Tax=Camellia lanceoleosa TaxID=1840588 RepID=A0ACC0FD70_9ERIC|nr:hypothetical protein LOK49_LG14G01609 [Camellia lanceoleosa]
MNNHCKELSEDCWELILNRLAIDDFNNLQSPSLVCKQFLSITDRFRLKLNCSFWVGSSIPLSHFFTKIPIPQNYRKLGSTMKNLKILRCCNLIGFRNQHLFAIADALPLLEELDIQSEYNYNLWAADFKSAKYMVTDAGIEVLSRKLRGLRKINMNGLVGCSDRSLIALSSNCQLLNEIRCSFCKVTEHGICFVLRHSRNLVCLKTRLYCSSPDDSFTFENSMIYATSLRDLDLVASGDNERLICSIATSGIPLEKFILHDDSGLSLHGLVTFLCVCPSLTHLGVCYTIPQRQFHEDLCQYLLILSP